MNTNNNEFKMADYATYRYQVTHDSGKFTISVLARSEAHGRERIMNNENCPDRSIETLLYSPLRKINIKL